MSEGQETVSERELASFLEDEIFTGRPRSVGEAVQAVEVPEPPIEAPPAEVVHDAPPEEQPPTEEELRGQEPSETYEAPAGEEEETPPEPESADDEDTVWAKKRFGDDYASVARAARHQERHISKLESDNRELREQYAGLVEYTQRIEVQASQTHASGMPLSAAEEQWVETNAMMNPLEAARQAAWNGNIPLFNAVLQRIAEDNAGMAANIGAQVQYELRQAADQQAAAAVAANGAGAGRSLADALGASFQRLGLDIQQHGPAMSEKIAELGEYHPYVQAIMHGDDAQRDLAVQAVNDLVRASTLTQRRVRDEERASAVRREGELRREAAGVVQGSPHVPPPAKDPFIGAMEQEWRARRQYAEE